MTYPVPVQCGLRTFVVRIQGFTNDPLARDGEFAFVDPDRAPQHLDLVIVDREEWLEPRTRQFIQEGSAAWVRAASPAFSEPPQPVGGGLAFLGTVIFLGRLPGQS